MGEFKRWLLVGVVTIILLVRVGNSQDCRNRRDYGDALTKCILFFEGQRSGKLPSSQRVTWRNDSALQDGFQIGVDLVGGYYDAGDNVKFSFPMAFTTTMLAWSVLEYGDHMGPDLYRAIEAIKWATDYLIKATSVPGFVFVQVGDGFGDHNCWERPEDMDTPRTPFAVSEKFPGSEVSAEIAAALASSSIVFRKRRPHYADQLLQRAKSVFKFADTHRGNFKDTLGPWVCKFYCDFNGYQDELVWAATWLYKATNVRAHWNYVTRNIHKLEAGFAEFGWDAKNAGVSVLASTLVLSKPSNLKPFVTLADRFVCTVLPESPTVTVKYSPDGLLFKSGGSNLQHTTALSFLLLTYAGYLAKFNRQVHCGDVVATPEKLVQFVQGQVDYILGCNLLDMSYMVGYGENFPRFIHHRGSSLPSINHHPSRIDCHGGTPYFESSNPNPNRHIGAIVGGPDINDQYNDSRVDFVHSEPTTYINAPLVGVLAYLKSNHSE